ncbi:MAG: hypothetical protein K5639_07985 [Eubacterium sp.]|nr:hypothetical protein [Eubacterium sp.]
MSRIAKKALAIVLACSMAFAFTPVAGKSDAKAKKPSLKTKNVVTIVGESEKNTVKANGNVVKSVTWKLKNNKFVSFKKSGKLSAKFTGKKVGSTQATATVKYKKTKKSKKTSKVTLKFIVDVEGGEEDPEDGAWIVEQADPKLSENIIAGIASAMASAPEITFEPIAVVATQIVGGSNYRVVGAYRDKKEDKVATYAILQFCSDLDGKWTLADDYMASDVPVCNANSGMGSWQPCQGEDLVIPDRIIKDIDDYQSQITGLRVDPAAVVAMQPTTDYNYMIVAQGDMITETPEEGYYLVFANSSNEGFKLGADYDGDGQDEKIVPFTLKRLGGEEVTN